MNKFEPGQLVECISTTGSSFIEGEVYVVRSFHPEGYRNHGTVMVQRDSKGSTTNGWSAEFFKLAEGPW